MDILCRKGNIVVMRHDSGRTYGLRDLSETKVLHPWQTPDGEVHDSPEDAVEHLDLDLAHRALLRQAAMEQRARRQAEDDRIRLHRSLERLGARWHARVELETSS